MNVVAIVVVTLFVFQCVCLSECVVILLYLLPAVLVLRYFRINASANVTHFPLVQRFRWKVFGIF